MSKQHSSPALLAGLEPLSRRSLLRTSVLAGVAVSAGCARVFGRKEAPDQLEYVHLSEDEVRVITRLTVVLLPTERHGLPSSTETIPTVKNVDAMVGQMSPQTRELLGLGLWVFERRPMMSFKFSRFSKLDTEEATRYVHAMQEGNFFERGLTTTLKALVTLNYWRDSRTWPALDYWGPVTQKWGVRRLGNAPLPPV